MIYALLSILVVALSCLAMRSKKKSLKNLKVLVAGGTKGLGAALVHQLCDRMHSVTLLDVVKPSEAVYLKEFIEVDLGCERSCKQAFANFENDSFDAVVYCAGVFHMNSVLDCSETEINRVWQTNYFGALRVAKKFRAGKIFFVSSEGAILTPTAYTYPYISSKRALEDLAQMIRFERPRMKVTIVRPGAMRTDMLNQLYELGDDRDEVVGVRRMAGWFAKYWNSDPDDVAGRIVNAIESCDPPEVLNIGHNPLLRAASIFPRRIVHVLQSVALRLFI